MPHIKNFGHAVDIGAHCGLWSRPLSKMFGRVTAFEPEPEHRACFFKNIGMGENVVLYDYALGDEDRFVTMKTGPNSSGDTIVEIKHGDGPIAHMIKLDSLDLPRIDFLKIDCEGFEYFILQGAEQTIKKWRPTIIVEQKPGKGKQFGLNDTAAVTLLESWGAKVVKEISGDFIMKF